MTGRAAWVQALLIRPVTEDQYVGNWIGTCDGPDGATGSIYTSCSGGATLLRGRRSRWFVYKGRPHWPQSVHRRLCGECFRAYIERGEFW